MLLNREEGFEALKFVGRYKESVGADFYDNFVKNMT